MFKPRDLCTCPRLGPGVFRIVDARGSGALREVRLNSIDNPTEFSWIYEAHCHADIKLKRHNAASNVAVKMQESQAILNKPKRKK